MKNKMIILAILINSNLFAMDLGYYKTLRMGTDAQKLFLWTYLDGVKEGALAMFTINPMNIDSKICLPYNLVSKGIDAYKIIEEQSKISEGISVEELFVKGVARNYPCK